MSNLHEYICYTFTPDRHGHFIHSQSKTLFIFGGLYQSFGAMNLETKKIKYDNASHKYNKSNLIKKYGKHPFSCYLEGRNELHVIDDEGTHEILKIANNVKIKDLRGNMIADELIFDIKDKKLNISSFGNNKINTKLKLNEKRF